MLLSVDQSYTSSGIVLLTDVGELFYAELFTSDASKDVFDRAWDITNYIARMADQYHVRFISVEGLAYAKAGDATRDLAGLQFVMVTYLRQLCNYHVEIVYPTTAKKYATGKGNSKKEQLLEHLPEDVSTWFKDKLNAKKSTGLYDLTDAYWIGRVALDTVPTDYVSKPIDNSQLDDVTEQRLCAKLREQTGYDVRINRDTYMPEVYVNEQWVQIELAE